MGDAEEQPQERTLTEELSDNKLDKPKPEKDIEDRLKGFYSEKLEKKLILRDELAIERTRLAEERTQLSYIRTGSTLLLAGMFFIGNFPPDTFFSYVGYITSAAAVLFLVYGFSRHRRSRRFLDGIIETLKEADRYEVEEEIYEEEEP